MKQETANLCLVILTVCTFITLVWYTYQTWKMQRAVTNQSKELNHQVRLSIKPAFATELVGKPNFQIKLYNVGNETAIDIEIENMIFPWSNNEAKVFDPPELVFDRVSLLRPGEAVLAQCLSRAFGREENRNFVARLSEENAEGKTYELKLRFRDIEGSAYKQTILMGKGGTRPREVDLDRS